MSEIYTEKSQTQLFHSAAVVIISHTISHSLSHLLYLVLSHSNFSSFGIYIIWDIYMVHVFDKYLYEKRIWDMYLSNILYGTPIWGMYVTNTYMYVRHVYVKYILWDTHTLDMSVINNYFGHICGTCIWQIHYMGHQYGTRM